MERKLVAGVVLACVLVAVAGCAAGANTLKGEADEEGRVAGFWRGLWHGIIAPVTFMPLTRAPSRRTSPSARDPSKSRPPLMVAPSR